VRAVTILVVWFLGSFRPARQRAAALDRKIAALRLEQDELARRIAEEQRRAAEERFVPARLVAPPAAPGTPIDRLRYFLQSITVPANDLELRYFAVTPLPPVRGPGYEEIPFSISVTGRFAALADYLYQLEYGRSFVVRELSMERGEGGDVQAQFQLAALLATEPPSSAAPAPAPPEDPGRPTSLELARDPFAEPPARLASAPDGKRYFLNVPPGLALSGTMRTGGRMVAIINHEPYRVGMRIDNKTITRIDERGVELGDDVRTYFLEMEQPPPSAGGDPQEASRR
jgi:hypothetical protein